MTTIDTSTEAVTTLFVALLNEAREDCVFVDSAVGVNDTQLQLDRIAAAFTLVPALLKERDEARALVAAAISRAEYHADRNTTAADVFRDISALATDQIEKGEL